MPHSKTRPTAIDRRRFLQHTWRGVGASLSLALLSGRSLFAQHFRDNSFTLGVASGDPTPDGIVLWTRLAPDPRDPTSLGNQFLPVRWRVATDESMQTAVAAGTATALPELTHSVHVEVGGTSVEDPNGAGYDSGSWVVEDGVPGAQPA